MAQFGGTVFAEFSVPLVFEGRYFIMEPGNPPLITVVLEVEGEPVFEVLKNQPAANDITETSSDPAGRVTVSDRDSGRFLYKVHLDNEARVTFAKQDGGELSAVITDKDIRIGGMIISNHHYRDSMAGVFVDPAIGVGMMDPPIPPQLAQWLS